MKLGKEQLDYVVRLHTKSVIDVHSERDAAIVIRQIVASAQVKRNEEDVKRFVGALQRVARVLIPNEMAIHFNNVDPRWKAEHLAIDRIVSAYRDWKMPTDDASAVGPTRAGR